MNNICQILDFDADVLLFNKDTYIVSRFKELIHESFNQKFRTRLSEHHNDFSVSGVLNNLAINEVNFLAEDIVWQSSIEGVNCQVLRVGSTGWQAGKLRIKVSSQIISPNKHRESGNFKINIFLEFYPNEALEAESPLDDIRKMMQAT